MLKRPEDITLPDGRTLRQALDDHSKWLIDKTTGKRLDLTGADMSRADLTGANMTSATMIRVNLCETKMIHADMSYAHMTGADMSYSDIVGARLYRANLTGANLTGADMSYSDIIGATMYGVDLTDANRREKAGPNRRKLAPRGFDRRGHVRRGLAMLWQHARNSHHAD